MGLLCSAAEMDINKQILDSLASIYVSMIQIDLETEKFRIVKEKNGISELLSEGEPLSSQFMLIVERLVAQEFISEMTKFLDFETLEKRLEGRKVIRCEYKAKDERWYRASFIPSGYGEENNLKSVLFGITSVDADKQKELNIENEVKTILKSQGEMYTEMLQNQSAGVIAYDFNTKKILMMNSAAFNLFGWECISTNDMGFILDKIQSPKKDKVLESINNIRLMDDELTYEFAVKRNEGSYIFILGHSKAVMLSNNTEIVICSFTNITKLKKMERELFRLSQTDGLTKINNRASGEARVESYLRQGIPGMFCLLDANKFKIINDTYGHGVGDAVLVEIARAMKLSFRDNDVVMRLGGDEFAIFVAGVKDEKAGKILLDRFYNNIDRIEIAELKEHNHKITVSLGAVLCEEKRDSEGKIIRDKDGCSIIEETFDGLYQKADSAMYICKHNRGNNYGFYRLEGK